MLRTFPFLLLLLFSLAAFPQVSTDEALATQFFRGGEYEKALPLYQKLFEKTSSQNYYDQYFTVLLRLKKYDEAEKVLKRLLKASPKNPAYQVDYGRLLQERGEQEKGKAWFNQLIKDLPKDEFAIRELSTMFYRAEAYDFSIKTLLAGRELLGDESAFTFDLISLYRYQKNKEMLIQEFLKELEKNEQVLNQAQNIISSTLEGKEDYEILRKILIGKIQRNPQNIAFVELLSWTYLQQNENDLALRQIISLDKRLKENGERVYDLAWTFITSESYSTAVAALEYIIAKGKDNLYYLPAKIQMLNTKNQILLSGAYKEADLLQLEKEYQALLQEYGSSSNTIFAIRQLANLQAYYLKKPQSAVALLENLIKIPNLATAVVAQAKLALGDLYILTGEVWEATLIYGQVEKQFPNEPVGQEAKFKSAKLSYFQGDFTWAKAQLDVLKSATSQLIANDALNLSLQIAENSSSPTDSNALKTFSRAELQAFKKNLPEALSILDSINKTYPGTSLADDILMSKARIYLDQKKINDAVGQLQQIIQNFSFDLWADDALMLLADLNHNQLKDRNKAQELYQKLITDYPGSLHVNEARKKFRDLRGDQN